MVACPRFEPADQTCSTPYDHIPVPSFIAPGTPSDFNRLWSIGGAAGIAIRQIYGICGASGRRFTCRAPVSGPAGTRRCSARC